MLCDASSADNKWIKYKRVWLRNLMSISAQYGILSGGLGEHTSLRLTGVRTVKVWLIWWYHVRRYGISWESLGRIKLLGWTDCPLDWCCTFWMRSLCQSACSLRSHWGLEAGKCCAETTFSLNPFHLFINTFCEKKTFWYPIWNFSFTNFFKCPLALSELFTRKKEFHEMADSPWEILNNSTRSEQFLSLFQSHHLQPLQSSSILQVPQPRHQHHPCKPMLHPL